MVGHHPHPIKREHVIIEHHWTFLTHQKKLHILPASTYLYPFELALPGHLAESFDSHSFGSLSYKLKVTVERPAFSPNTHHRRLFWVHRQLPRPEDDDAMEISNEWDDKLSYRMSVPGRIYKRGQEIPIYYELLPATDTHLRHISCFLKEYLTSPSHQDSRIVQFFRDHEHQGHRTLKVPSSPSAIQTDCDHALIKIQHQLKFNMSLIRHGQLLEVRASMPIKIMTEPDELPTYENAWQTSPYSSPITPLDGVALDYFSIPLPAYEL